MQVPEVGVVEAQLGVVDECLVTGAVVEEVVEAGNIKVNKGNYHARFFIF